MNQSQQFTNWYVLHTMAGNEEMVAKTLHKFLSPGISFYLPRREVIHTIKGQEKRVHMALFPGYLFVQNDIEILAHHLAQKEWVGTAAPLKFHDRFVSVFPHEMEFLFSMAGPDGVIPVSKGVCQGGRVKIVHGPLKEREGDILFVNRRKKKARVRVSLVSRCVDVTLGLELVRESQGVEA